jgi:hypothetical protein
MRVTIYKFRFLFSMPWGLIPVATGGFDYARFDFAQRRQPPDFSHASFKFTNA